MCHAKHAILKPITDGPLPPHFQTGVPPKNPISYGSCASSPDHTRSAHVVSLSQPLVLSHDRGGAFRRGDTVVTRSRASPRAAASSRAPRASSSHRRVASLANGVPSEKESSSICGRRSTTGCSLDANSRISASKLDSNPIIRSGCATKSPNGWLQPSFHRCADECRGVTDVSASPGDRRGALL